MVLICVCCGENFKRSYPQGFMKELNGEGICEKCEENAPKEDLTQAILDMAFE